MRFFALLYRGARFVSIVTMFLMKTSFVRQFNKNDTARNRALAVLTHRYTGKVMKVFRINVAVTGMGELSDDAPCLIVSNHLSYLDILVLSSVKPTLFLSHKGIEREPVIGAIAANGGTLFVDKSTKTKLIAEMGRLANMLKEGITMTLFPEGGTGNGEAVASFHSAFIEAAMLAGVPVLPICLQYRRINNEPVTKENKSFVVLDKMPFMPHIWALFRKLNTLDVTITVFDRISTRGGDRKEVSDMARSKIAREYAAI